MPDLCSLREIAIEVIRELAEDKNLSKKSIIDKMIHKYSSEIELRRNDLTKIALNKIINEVSSNKGKFKNNEGQLEIMFDRPHLDFVTALPKAVAGESGGPSLQLTEDINLKTLIMMVAHHERRTPRLNKKIEAFKEIIALAELNEIKGDTKLKDILKSTKSGDRLLF